MSFTAQLGVAQNGDFIRRVQMAVIKAAIDIQAENPATANHAQRSALAYRVLHEPEAYAPKFAMAVATNPVIVAASADADIQLAVNSMWDAFAVGGE